MRLIRGVTRDIMACCAVLCFIPQVGCRMKPNEHYMDYTGSSVYCQSQIEHVGGGVQPSKAVGWSCSWMQNFVADHEAALSQLEVVAFGGTHGPLRNRHGKSTTSTDAMVLCHPTPDNVTNRCVLLLLHLCMLARRCLTSCAATCLATHTAPTRAAA